MTIRRLEHWEWARFCSFASRYLIGKRADIATPAPASALEIDRHQCALASSVIY
jgi:hypothetical protein